MSLSSGRCALFRVEVRGAPRLRLFVGSARNIRDGVEVFAHVLEPECKGGARFTFIGELGLGVRAAFVAFIECVGYREQQVRARSTLGAQLHRRGREVVEVIDGDVVAALPPLLKAARDPCVVRRPRRWRPEMGTLATMRGSPPTLTVAPLPWE